MKRILYIESGVTGGGSFASLLLQLSHIDRNEYTPVVVFLNTTPFREKVEALGITTYLLAHPLYAPRADLRARLYRRAMRHTAQCMPAMYLTVYSAIHQRLIRVLQRIVHRHGIDIIHINNNVVRDLFGVLAGRSTGAACVSHLRAVPGQQAYARRVNTLINAQVCSYIAISEFIRERWTSYGLDPHKCRVIHNGIAPLRVAPLNLRREFGLQDVSTIICSVGRLIHWKNHAFLIRGFAAYHRLNPSSALVLVGDGPERNKLEGLAADLGVAANVVFAGQSSHAKEILAGSDIFVHPSRDEPFGRVTLEAMALKVPVVATRSGGNTELVNDGETGCLVAVDDVHGLRDTLRTLVDDADLRRRLVAAAYASTRGRFHIDHCVTAVERIYGEICARGALPAGATHG